MGKNLENIQQIHLYLGGINVLLQKLNNMAKEEKDEELKTLLLNYVTFSGLLNMSLLKCLSELIPKHTKKDVNSIEFKRMMKWLEENGK